MRPFSLPLHRCRYGQTPSNSLSLTRPARPWNSLSATGQRAASWGTNPGRLEAWVYPLKVFRGFHLKFLVGGREDPPAEALVRTLTVHPESTSLTYASDTFRFAKLSVPLSTKRACSYSWMWIQLSL